MTASDDPHLRVDVVRGNPTDEEVAAVIAVVTEAYAQEAAAAIADDTPATTAWQVSARALRQPLQRDVTWGTFRG